MVSSHNALATVVLPTPAEPDNNKLGTFPSLVKSDSVPLILSDKTHSEIVGGLYRSTHNNESCAIIFHFHNISYNQITHHKMS